jgi:tRNA modification GTPase
LASWAAVMTGKGTGALATVQIYGDTAEACLRLIFTTAGNTAPDFTVGKILLGTIAQGETTIDQVTIGCEVDRCFAIHCHGNPLIVEQIMALLQSQGVTLLDADQLLAWMWSQEQSMCTPAIEARLAIPRAKTLLGTRHLYRQITGGLTQALIDWQAVESLAAIRQAAQEVWSTYAASRRIIFGCHLALIGPPNSGKSTLLNSLAGQQKAIVTDIRGTTRDWIEAPCHLGSLYVTLIDTAGLDPSLTDHRLDQQSQNRTVAVLPLADLVLLVLDVTLDASQINQTMLTCIQGKPVITVLNKNDREAVLAANQLPSALGHTVSISAQQQIGIDPLIESIHTILGVHDMEVGTPMCFTERQHQLLGQLNTAPTMDAAQGRIKELLWGQVD